MNCEGRGHRVRQGHLKRNERLVQECELVPVEPFRVRFEHLRDTGQMNASQLCWQMGWVYRVNDETARRERRRVGSMKPDPSHALTVLGLRQSRRSPHGRTTVTYDTAIRLARALGLDPHEAGI